jgi:hypothetical protein
MTKPKTWVDLEPSVDAGWSAHQPITIGDLVAEAPAADWDFTDWCYASGYDAATRDPGACLNACWIMPGARAAPACIDPHCCTRTVRDPIAGRACRTVLAAPNRCLAENNKSCTGGEATKKRKPRTNW